MTSSKILKIAQLWPSSEPQGRGHEPLWPYWVKWCISRRKSWTGRGAIYNVIADFVMLCLLKDSTLHCASALYFEKKEKNKTNILQNRNNNVWRNVVNMKMFKIQMYATHERQIILNFRRNWTLDTFLNMYLIFLVYIDRFKKRGLERRQCCYKPEDEEQCRNPVLPYTNHCLSRILVLLKFTYYLDYFVSFIYSFKTAMKYSNNLDSFLLKDEINIKINFKMRNIVV